MKAKPLRDVIDNIFKQKNLKNIRRLIYFEQLWKKIVGKTISKNTKVIDIKMNTLIIKTINPIWRNELSLQKTILIEKINNESTKTKLTEIKFK